MKVYSEYDSRGYLYVDCTECKRGHNGDRSCGSGWRYKKARSGGCFSGQPLRHVEEELAKEKE